MRAPRPSCGPRTARVPALLAVLALVAVLQACGPADGARDHLTPREAYERSLRETGLWGTEQTQAWIRAGSEAVNRPATVALPFEEDGVLTTDRPNAMGYRVHLGRGRRLRARITLSYDMGTQLFVELFRIPPDSAAPPQAVAWTDSTADSLVYEPWEEGDFVLRLQPELHRGGRYRLVLRNEPQLSFPVAGRTIKAVWSRFGDPRDGGRRRHEGIDIFAPRNTPVLAAASGVVSRVRITRLGGKVVWVRDGTRRASEYYAHLDSQAVHRGQVVDVGDTLGFVGNTGNARTTRTHLHFGVYRRGQGAVDPYPFVSPPARNGPAVTADVAPLGGWAYATDSGIRLRAAPDTDADVLRELGSRDRLRLMGAASGSWYRVRLGDGSVGYVASRFVRPGSVESTEAAATTPQEGP